MLIVLDLDGVVYRGNAVIPHAAEAIERLTRAGHEVWYFTNNSAQTRKAYRAKLAGMGIRTTSERIMTSAYATALRLQPKDEPPVTALIVGQGGLVDELEAVGVRLVEATPGARADFVVVGIDRAFTYAKLKAAQQAILAGAHFIATNRDPVYPLEGGELEPGSGALVSAIETASRAVPEVIGKPNPAALLMILERSGFPPASTVLIGDRADTDIACGKAAGVHTILVLTGTLSRDDADALPPDQRADLTLDDLRGLDMFILQMH